MATVDVFASVVPQIYETELQDRVTDQAVRFVTIPARSLEGAEILLEPHAVMEALEVRQLGNQLQVSEISYAVAALIEKPDDADSAAEFFDLVRSRSEAFGHDHPEKLAFAEYVAYGNVVPFEHSPLSADALGSILASGSGVSIGAGVGFMVAGGPTPLLLITVPVGIIICASAKGVADGMEEGLRYKIRRLMGLPQGE